MRINFHPDNRWMNYLRQGYNALLDFVFYPYCYLCEGRLDTGKQLICERCWQSYRYPSGGRQLSPDDFHFQQKTYFDKSFTLYIFSEKSLLLIHLFKYDHKSSLGERIGMEIGQFITSTPTFRNVDMLVPIPLHPVRKRERGYNQSEILTKYASLQSSIPVMNHLMKRTINNPSQTGLNLEERKKNIEGIFEVTEPHTIKGKRILLVDDVMTSGVTMNECAKILKRAGATEAFCLAVIHPERL